MRFAIYTTFNNYIDREIEFGFLLPFIPSCEVLYLVHIILQISLRYIKNICCIILIQIVVFVALILSINFYLLGIIVSYRTGEPVNS